MGNESNPSGEFNTDLLRTVTIYIQTQGHKLNAKVEKYA